ncbi:MAG: head GIN domain-containing protein, partial [Bacteroidota bacterium]
LLSGAMLMLPGLVSAQDFAKETREVAEFTGIDVGGAFTIYLSQGDESKIVVETASDHLDKVLTEVNNGILDISSKGIRNFNKLNVYITCPEISSLNVHGAAELKGNTSFEGNTIMIKSSGASTTKLELYYDEVISDVSGAATLILSGEASMHKAKVSGAADLKASELTTELTKATTTGASTAHVHTTDTGDTTSVRVAGIKVEVIDDDSTMVTVGNRSLIVDEEGNVSWSKVKYRKFNGHWAGIELGVNGYLTKDFDMNFSPADDFMDLRMEKSMQFNLNLYEQNVALSKNHEWGMYTGIGISWNNYRFRNPTTLNSDSAYLIGYIDKGISVRKSKLAIAYLQIPLVLEWQNHASKKINSFHVGVGVIMGVRMWSWQKKYYDELNKEYTLTQYDPAAGQYVDRWNTTSPDENKIHEYDDYHMQPFKADATFRIGWGYVNLFATYNLIPMFRKAKGPELHQFAAGITLLGW